MKSDRVVLNASPLIVLFKADLAHVLPQVFTEILVPGSVWEEVAAGGSTGEAAQQLPKVDWAKRVELATIAPAVLSWNLGNGEAEVLTIVLSHPGHRAVG